YQCVEHTAVAHCAKRIAGRCSAQDPFQVQPKRLSQLTGLQQRSSLNERSLRVDGKPERLFADILKHSKHLKGIVNREARRKSNRSIGNQEAAINGRS